MSTDTHPGFYGVYDTSRVGDDRFQTVARFPMTDDGEDDCRKFLRAEGNGHFEAREETIDDIMTLPTEFALRAFRAGKMEVDNPHFGRSWQVRLVWDEDTDEPGEVIHGGFATEDDANLYVQHYPDGEGISDFVVEMVNLVVFH